MNNLLYQKGQGKGVGYPCSFFTAQKGAANGTSKGMCGGSNGGQKGGPGHCKRCLSTARTAEESPHKEKKTICNKCGKPGHIAAACGPPNASVSRVVSGQPVPLRKEGRPAHQHKNEKTKSGLVFFVTISIMALTCKGVCVASLLSRKLRERTSKP